MHIKTKVSFVNVLIIFGFLTFQILYNENPHLTLGKFKASFFYTGGSPAGKTGAPGEGNCTQCHAGMVNSGLTTSTLTSSGNNEYVPGNTYNLTLDIQNGSTKNGFQIVVLDSISNSNAGNLTITDANNTKLISGNNRSYISHKAPGTSLTHWSFDWTAPSSNVGPITFYYAYNVTNNASNSSEIKFISRISLFTPTHVVVFQIRHKLQMHLVLVIMMELYPFRQLEGIFHIHILGVMD